MLNVFKDQEEDLKKDLFFALSKKVSQEGRQATSANVENMIRALWPDVTTEKKAELEKEVAQKLIDLDELNSGFFVVVQVLLKYASDQVKRDFVDKLRKKPCISLSLSL